MRNSYNAVATDARASSGVRGGERAGLLEIEGLTHRGGGGGGGGLDRTTVSRLVGVSLIFVLFAVFNFLVGIAFIGPLEVGLLQNDCKVID
jgi:hypothetical protein